MTPRQTLSFNIQAFTMKTSSLRRPLCDELRHRCVFRDRTPRSIEIPAGCDLVRTPSCVSVLAIISCWSPNKALMLWTNTQPASHWASASRLCTQAAWKKQCFYQLLNFRERLRTNPLPPPLSIRPRNPLFVLQIEEKPESVSSQRNSNNWLVGNSSSVWLFAYLIDDIATFSQMMRFLQRPLEFQHW